MALKEAVVPHGELKEVLETRVLAETGINLSSVDLELIKPSHGTYVTVEDMNVYLNHLEGTLKKTDPTISLDNIRTRVSNMVVQKQPRGGTPDQVMRSMH